jgi:hypothetical protein
VVTIAWFLRNRNDIVEKIRALLDLPAIEALVSRDAKNTVSEHHCESGVFRLNHIMLEFHRLPLAE